MHRSPLDEKTKHPIIVPKNYRIAEMLVTETHTNLGHYGKSSVVAHLRKRYWIVGIKAIVNRVVSKCVICRKFKANRMCQKMADLPSYVVEPYQPAFTKPGCIYFGPIEIKRGRSVVKRYGGIFACLSTRAIHLEVADSLNTDSCVNAIRVFALGVVMYNTCIQIVVRIL